VKNNKADISLIRKYLNGELDARAMYDLERLAQDDPALMDMIQGVENSTEDIDESNLTDISRMISLRVQNSRSGQQIGSKTEELGTDNFTIPKTENRINWKLWMAAASLFIISSIGVMLWVQRPSDPQVIEDNSIAQDQQQVTTPEIVKAKPDTVQSRGTILPEIKTDIAVLSRKKINPVITQSSRATLAIPEEDSRTKVVDQLLMDSNSVLMAKTEQLKTNSDTMSGLNEVNIIRYAAKRKMQTSAAITIAQSKVDSTLKTDSFQTALAGKVAGVSVMNSSNNLQKIITGTVTDKITNDPVPGAAVILRGQDRGITTDPKGMFSLAVPPKTNTLLVSVIGYEQQEVKLNKNNTLHIAMAPSNQFLNEVVVTGYGAAKMEKSHPANGWIAYNKYLADNARSVNGYGGKVTIAFTIDRKGNPADLRIVEGNSSVLNQRAMRLILDGSQWIRNPKNVYEEVTLIINFH
jgi:hypothetical protein